MEFFASDTEKNVVFIDLLLIITELLNPSTQNIKPAHFRALVQWGRSVLAPDTEDDKRFESCIKEGINRTELSLNTNLGTFVCRIF